VDLLVVTTTLPDFMGEAWLVTDLDAKDDYYVVSRAVTPDHGDETMIFEADENGDVTNWTERYADWGVDHYTAIAGFEAQQGA
jgi:hypothetical protein